MKLKINAFYAAGIALMTGAAATGDGFSAVLPSQWGGGFLTAILMIIGGICCIGYARGLEIEQESRKRRQRIERPDYRKDRRMGA